MTKEEKITELINIRDNFNYTLAPREVFDDAIKALEREDVLDKIKADIEFEVDHRTNMLCAEDVFAILDKYKPELSNDEIKEYEER